MADVVADVASEDESEELSDACDGSLPEESDEVTAADSEEGVVSAEPSDVSEELIVSEEESDDSSISDTSCS